MCESGRSASSERTPASRYFRSAASMTWARHLSFGDRLNAELDEGRAIVIDLSTASFVDSSILGVILEGGRRATADGLGFEVAQRTARKPSRGYSTSPACAASCPCTRPGPTRSKPPGRHRTGRDRERTRASPRASGPPRERDRRQAGRRRAGGGNGVPTQRVDDLKTVVTEACNNVVLHAYGGGGGPARGDRQRKRRRDRDRGSRPGQRLSARSGVGDELPWASACR